MEIELTTGMVQNVDLMRRISKKNGCSFGVGTQLENFLIQKRWHRKNKRNSEFQPSHRYMSLDMYKNGRLNVKYLI